MAFTVSNFTSALKHQGARASLFEVTMTGGILQHAIADDTSTSEDEAEDAKTGDSDAFKFSCRATTIPGLTVTSIPVMYFGREIKTPGEMEFADWSVTILNDNAMRIRRFISKWMSGLNSHKINKFKTQFYADTSTNSSEYSFTGEANIQQYTKTGTASSKYTMHQCWPTSMDPISMGYDNTGTIQEYGVTFSMNYWTADHSNTI